MARKHQTIIDAVERHFGALDPAAALKLSQAELDEVAELVASFYGSWTPGDGEDAHHVYSGENIGMANAEGLPALDSLRSNLIYHPSVAVHCPLGTYYTRDVEHLDLPRGPKLKPGEYWVDTAEYLLRNTYFTARLPIDGAREALRNQLAILKSIKPLVERGVVALVPPWKIVRQRQAAISAAMRFDVADDEFVGMLATPGFMVRSIDGIYMGAPELIAPRSLSDRQKRLLIAEAPSFYQNKMIAVADTIGAVYIPPSADEYRLIGPRYAKLRQEVRAKSSVELNIARDISRIRLPLFSGASMDTLIAIRENEVAFDDFRAELATLFRTLKVDDEDPSFPDELREAISDALAPRLSEIRATTGRSATLKAASAVGGTELVVGAAGGLAMMGGNPLGALVGVGISAISAAILRMIFRPKLQGANIVFSALLSDH